MTLCDLLWLPCIEYIGFCDTPEEYDKGKCEDYRYEDGIDNTDDGLSNADNGGVETHS